MPFKKEGAPAGEPPNCEPERHHETCPAGPLWTEKEIQEEKRRRQEDPNWLREQE